VKKPSVRSYMFLQVLKKARYGTVALSLPDGKREVYGEGEPTINVEVRDWSGIDLLFGKGDVGLAEAIIGEIIVVDDVAALVQWACRNDRDLGRALYGSWYGNLAERLRHFLNRNDRVGAKKNIVAHYDLGNEFYSLWLDSTMTYSSALFANPEQASASQDAQALEQAQKAKYDRIIDTLNIRPGDHILEIGCGWGGFFSRAVERTGCKVTAVMNSPEQARHNRQMIEHTKLSPHVTLLQQDYRDIDGRFDKVVSIEMIEAVGEKYWDQFFGKVSSTLKSKGCAVIQGITIRDDLFYSYRKNTDFIQQYVFPGGMLPTQAVFSEKSHAHDMSLGNQYLFGTDYARTLSSWRLNFNKALPHVRAMGFDDKFIRLWNLYLAYCEGAFRAGRINVGQFHLAKGA
jgi:cyclopropane-fatty-acyl-phospholipid synthase